MSRERRGTATWTLGVIMAIGVAVAIVGACTSSSGGAPNGEDAGTPPVGDDGSVDSTTGTSCASECGVAVDSGVDATLDGGVDSGSADAGTDATCALDAGGNGLLCQGSICVDTTSDPNNCGGCSVGGGAGYSCEAGAVCASSHCENVAGSLVGLRWQLPCTAPQSSVSCATVVDGSDVQVLTATLSGASEETYIVTLHFRGEVEQKTYSGDVDGGAVGGEDGGVNPQYFVSGGSPGGDSFNIYELDVSEPPQTYFLNAGTSGIDNTWPLDYLATVPMTAGAALTLTANAVDDGEILNINAEDGGPVYVPGVPPYPAAYDGQFIQMDVVSVVPQP